MSSHASPPEKPISPTVRWALLGLGLVSVLLGLVGIVVPVLPTVPFLLLAAACFARSSERFYRWLTDHAHLGPMIRPYLENRAMQRQTRRRAIALLWISIFISLLIVTTVWVQITVLAVAIGVTGYLLSLPTTG